VSGLGADVGAHVVDDHAVLLLAGRDTGIRLAGADVIDALIEVAMRFAKIRGNAWRVAELVDFTKLRPGVELGAAFPPVTRPPVVQDTRGRAEFKAGSHFVRHQVPL
jgi:precorrin-3B synthase